MILIMGRFNGIYEFCAYYLKMVLFYACQTAAYRLSSCLVSGLVTFSLILSFEFCVFVSDLYIFFAFEFPLDLLNFIVILLSPIFSTI